MPSADWPRVLGEVAPSGLKPKSGFPETLIKFDSIRFRPRGVFHVRNLLTRFAIAAGAVVTVVTVGGAGWKF
jgi:hypothetical protein